MWHPDAQRGRVQRRRRARVQRRLFGRRCRAAALERWTFERDGRRRMPETLPDAEIVTWKSFDGLEISGVLYRPPAALHAARGR